MHETVVIVTYSNKKQIVRRLVTVINFIENESKN